MSMACNTPAASTAEPGIGFARLDVVDCRLYPGPW